MEAQYFQDQQLSLPRCSHCGVARPFLAKVADFETQDDGQTVRRRWVCYRCSTCGGVVLTEGRGPVSGLVKVDSMWPELPSVSEDVPADAREYLEQALGSLHAPAGAIMLAASSIDAMLKAKKLKDGNLNDRINKAAADHLITAEMAEWAHEVRFDANAQRHADNDIGLPTADDARRTLSFAKALAEFMFEHPARVRRDRAGGGGVSRAS